MSLLFILHEARCGESYPRDMQIKESEVNIMRDLEEIIAECERNAPSDDQIDYSQIPPITDFSKARSLNLPPRTKRLLSPDNLVLH